MSGEIGFGGNERLDRLGESARNGYASPQQMLRLIAEVRQRRDSASHRVQELAGFVQIVADIDPEDFTTRPEADCVRDLTELINQARGLMGEPPLPGTEA
jgi:hypothetical protein